MEQLARELRLAAAGREYQKVARLAGELGEAARAFAESLPKGDSRAVEAARQLHDLISWALVMMQAARSACTLELRRVTTATRYTRRCDEPDRTPGVHLDA
jgi:hypothetical protein